MNQFIQTDNSAPQAPSISPQCQNCGANLGYNPDKLGLFCEMCQAVTKIEARPAGRFPISELSNASQPRWVETRVFECQNCGAKEVVPGHEMSNTCAFCGSSTVVPSDDIPGLKPNAVIPFRVSKEKAIEAVTKWAKKKLFAPSRFKKNVVPKDVDGVYNPAFMFDATTTTRYNGVLSRTETTTSFVNGRSVVSTRTVRIPISGTHNGTFTNIMIQACDEIKQTELNKIQPFDNQNISEFNDAFLFGYVAGQHKRDGMACWGQARSDIEKRIQQEVLRQHPGCTVVSFNAQTNYNTASYRYTLIPIYVGHFTYRNKLFNFYINGDTGRITGKTPVSPLRVSALVGGIVAVVGGILALAIWLLLR